MQVASGVDLEAHYHALSCSEEAHFCRRQSKDVDEHLDLAREKAISVEVSGVEASVRCKE